VVVSWWVSVLFDFVRGMGAGGGAGQNRFCFSKWEIGMYQKRVLAVAMGDGVGMNFVSAIR